MRRDTETGQMRPVDWRVIFSWNRYSIIRNCYFQLSAKARQKEALEVEKSSASNIVQVWSEPLWRSTT